jgi:thiamine-monophosphate kinase
MERDLVHWFCQRLPAHPRVLVGPGDDAAVLRLSANSNLVATTDMLMDGVDFELGKNQPESVGRKALAVNLSDLAAMGASPAAALVSLALPRHGGEALAKRLYEGMIPLANEFDCPIAGGDTNSWEGPLVISVTALGEAPHNCRWRRSGAKPGDAIVVTGQFGGSILGKHFDFTPRLREALWLAENSAIHAAIDVSDGLSLDLFRLCEASGCGAALDLKRIPIAADAHRFAVQRGDGSTALDHALADGEDFELIMAIDSESAQKLVAEQPLGTPLTIVGTIIAEQGLFAQRDDGKQEPLAPRGYEHRLDA